MKYILITLGIGLMIACAISDPGTLTATGYGSATLLLMVAMFIIGLTFARAEKARHKKRLEAAIDDYGFYCGELALCDSDETENERTYVEIVKRKRAEVSTRIRAI